MKEPNGQNFQHRVVALERRRLGVPRPIRLERDLRHFAAVCPFGGDEKDLAYCSTTVFPRRGYYAFDSENIAKYPPADLTVEHIGDLVNNDLPALLGGANGSDAE